MRPASIFQKMDMAENGVKNQSRRPGLDWDGGGGWERIENLKAL